MQRALKGVVLTAVCALTLTLTATSAFGATADAQEARSFQTDGEWGVVKAEAYEASVDKNGSFVVKVRDAFSLKCSLIRQWVAFQSLKQARLMRASVERDDGRSVSFQFLYHWDECSVKETAKFDERGVEAFYEIAPWESRNLQFTSVYVEPFGFAENALKASGLRFLHGDDKTVEITAGKKVDSLLCSASFQCQGKRDVDVIGLDGSSLAIESAPRILIRDRGTPLEWKANCKAGETQRSGVKIFITSKNAEDAPRGPVEFQERR